jgi:hypothetical protein
VLAQYRESAKQKLGKRWEGVGREWRELVELEDREGERGVGRTLKLWDAGAGAGGFGLEDRVQILDSVLSGAWKISEPGGRYIRVVKRFERWLNGVWDILEARKQEKGWVGSDEKGEVMFVEELDGEWKDELQIVGRKLEGWRDQLGLLGEVRGKNSLAIVVHGVGGLVNGMLEEVKTMERVERDVMYREEEWIREAIEEGSEDESGNGSVPGAVWRSC